MKYNLLNYILLGLVLFPSLLLHGQKRVTTEKLVHPIPKVRMIPSEKFVFWSFVDCNMASVWIGDTFSIFPGKYGEDPLWGDSHELKFASGHSVDEVFSRKPEEFREPVMPRNVKPGRTGLHGAV